MQRRDAMFLILLETWEAAKDYVLASRDANSVQPIEIASLLGWAGERSGGRTDLQMNRTADACNAASYLIEEGLIEREDLIDLNVNQAREICTRANANRKRIVEQARVKDQ